MATIRTGRNSCLPSSCVRVMPAIWTELAILFLEIAAQIHNCFFVFFFTVSDDHLIYPLLIAFIITYCLLIATASIPSFGPYYVYIFVYTYRVLTSDSYVYTYHQSTKLQINFFLMSMRAVTSNYDSYRDDGCAPCMPSPSPVGRGVHWRVYGCQACSRFWLLCCHSSICSLYCKRTNWWWRKHQECRGGADGSAS